MRRIDWQPGVASVPKSPFRPGWPPAGDGGAMVTGVLFLVLVLSVLLLGAFIYQIVITPLTPVDAPTLLKSAAAPSAAALALPVKQPRSPAAIRPAPGTSSPRAARSQHPWATAALAIAGVAAITIGGWLFL